MEDHTTLRDDFHFDDMMEVPAQGRAGGIVLLWVTNMVTVTQFRQSTQELHAMIQVNPNHPPWLFSTIYASTKAVNRRELWENLENVSTSYNVPWLVVGDFNDTLRQEEKFGGRRINRSRSTRFWSCVNFCKLIDLGFKGGRYTWSNHRRNNNGLILERLDRCFANEDWLVNYLNVSITHLPKTYSEHNPLLIKTNNIFRQPLNTITKPFRLETYWSSHPEFENIVKESWQHREFAEATEFFTQKVTSRNRDTFGNIFYRKNKILARLNGIQHSQAYTTSTFLQSLEKILTIEYNNIL
ncbi:uncharacterized protein [Nicotiana sylvestris]|uniref:uncharacterized protein n=1 Tax=Nicotiana sylvestris TaxID=4096 RepID=UPI00388C7DD2